MRKKKSTKQRALQRRLILFGHVCVSHCGGLDRADSTHPSCVIEADSCILDPHSVSMHPPPLLLGVVAVESATQCQIVGKTLLFVRSIMV